MSSVDSPSLFAQVIQEHLELKRRNAALEHEMPIEKYMNDDPFENHPLFKTEEQARVEDTMDGVQSIEDEATSLDWPVSEDTFIDSPTVITPRRRRRRRRSPSRRRPRTRASGRARATSTGATERRTGASRPAVDESHASAQVGASRARRRGVGSMAGRVPFRRRMARSCDRRARGGRCPRARGSGTALAAVVEPRPAGSETADTLSPCPS